MDLDLRLTTLDRLTEALSLPATTMSVGHEGCPNKLPPAPLLREAAQAIRAQGKRFAFVAPILHERFAAQVLEQIEGLLSDGRVTVVANDMGLLLLLHERGWHKHCTLVAGHGLSFSFEQLPWLDLTLAEEPEPYRDAFYEHALASPTTWSQLKDLGVGSIEVDQLSRAAESFPTLRAAGFKLTMLLDVMPIAYSRSCHTARYYREAPPDCTSRCDAPFELTMTHRWRLYHNQLEPMSKGARAEVPGFTLFGNIVYRSAEATPIPFNLLDGLTLDVRFYTTDSLRERVDQVVASMV